MKCWFKNIFDLKFSYLAFHYPLQALPSTKRAKFMVAAAWILSSLCNLPQILNQILNNLKLNPGKSDPLFVKSQIQDNAHFSNTKSISIAHSKKLVTLMLKLISDACFSRGASSNVHLVHSMHHIQRIPKFRVRAWLQYM